MTKKVTDKAFELLAKAVSDLEGNEPHRDHDRESPVCVRGRTHDLSTSRAKVEQGRARQSRA